MTDEIKRVSIEELTPDDHNANEGTQRGLGLLDSSLRSLGAGRSIVLDKNLKVIAGNKTLERWVDLGHTDVLLVPSKGDVLIGVVREDLDLDSPDHKARELAYADNRVGQVDLQWSASQIAADLQAGVDLSGMWKPEELGDILGKAADDLLSGDGETPPDDFAEFGEDIATEHTCPKCGYKWSGKA